MKGRGVSMLYSQHNNPLGSILCKFRVINNIYRVEEIQKEHDWRHVRCRPIFIVDDKFLSSIVGLIEF